MNSKIRFAFASAMLAYIMSLANAQSASYYQQAASLYDQAAAKCSEPGASCMRQYANYNRCLSSQYSGGGSCGSGPSCSTACPSSAPSGGTNSTRSGSIGASNQTQQLANEIGDLLGQWSAARDAKREREAEELQRKLEREVAQMEAESAAEDERARERAAFLADPSGASMPANPADRGDDEAKLRAQLYAQASTDSGTVQPQTASADPSDQMAQMRAQMTAQARQQAEPDPLISSVTQNPQFISAYAQVQDPPPDASQIGTLDDLLDDKPIDPSAASLWQGMKETAISWTNSAGDLLKSHPLQSIAQSLGFSQDPNADPVQSVVHSCGVSMLKGAAPYPAGGDAAAAGCMNAVEQQGMGVVGMASDQIGTQ